MKVQIRVLIEHSSYLVMNPNGYLILKCVSEVNKKKINNQI